MMMTSADTTLAEGQEIRCPHCRRWHALHRADSGTGGDHPYATEMLFFTCDRRRGTYYAGQAGGTARHPVRAQCRPESQR